MMLRSCRLATAAVAASLIIAPAQAEQVLLTLPLDWTATQLAAPSVDGRPIAGSRRRAVLTGPEGRPLAAIELTELP